MLTMSITPRTMSIITGVMTIRIYHPGVSFGHPSHLRRPEIPELTIYFAIGGIALAIIWSGVARLRKTLASENKPKLSTYVNELGGYAVVAVLMVVFGLAALMGAFGPDAPQEAAGIAPQGINSGAQLETFSEGRYVVSIPPGWQRIPQTEHQLSDLYCVDQQNELHLTGSSLRSADVAIDDPLAMMQVILKKVREEATANLEVSEPQLVRVGNSPAARSRVSGTIGAFNLTFDLWVVREPDRWIELHLWTTRSRFPNHEPTFSQIVSSLRRVP